MKKLTLLVCSAFMAFCFNVNAGQSCKSANSTDSNILDNSENLTLKKDLSENDTTDQQVAQIIRAAGVGSRGAAVK